MIIRIRLMSWVFSGGLAALIFSSMALRPVYAETKLLYVHSDHLGTPQVLTDNGQKVVWKANYAPFGEAQVDEDPDGDGVVVEMPLRFPGQYYDRETGYHYNYFRDYDPTLGRYLQSDPIGLQGGINTYGYVYQNPLRYIDPLGLDALVVLYRGQNGNVFNHIGVGTTTGANANQTLGAGPKSGIGLFSPVPGHVAIDGGIPIATLTIPTTPAQDALINAYNAAAVNDPNFQYALTSQSCVNHVRGALTAGGITLPTPTVGSGRSRRTSNAAQNTIFPNKLFQSLSTLGTVVTH